MVRSRLSYGMKGKDLIDEYDKLKMNYDVIYLILQNQYEYNNLITEVNELREKLEEKDKLNMSLNQKNKKLKKRFRTLSSEVDTLSNDLESVSNDICSRSSPKKLPNKPVIPSPLRNEIRSDDSYVFEPMEASLMKENISFLIII